ncbi:MAG: hypothetical protein ACJAQW_001292, partial [Paracoccaceae bacterium]
MVAESTASQLVQAVDSAKTGQNKKPVAGFHLATKGAEGAADGAIRNACNALNSDLSPKFPPALRGVLGVKSLALGRHLVHRLSLQRFHRCQVAQC